VTVQGMLATQFQTVATACRMLDGRGNSQACSVVSCRTHAPLTSHLSLEQQRYGCLQVIASAEQCLAGSCPAEPHLLQLRQGCCVRLVGDRRGPAAAGATGS
jgi:hypothetical protein